MVTLSQTIIQHLNAAWETSISASQLESCSQKPEIIQPSPGELFWQSKDGEIGIYLILQGKVRLLDNGDNLVASLNQGKMFGQITLFSQGEFQAYTVRASLDLQVVYLDQKTIASLIKIAPQVRDILYRQTIELDLLLLHQQHNNGNISPRQSLLPMLPQLQQHHLQPGDRLPIENQQLWLLRKGAILHSSGNKLTPGYIYYLRNFPPDGSWKIMQATELYSLPAEANFQENLTVAQSLNYPNPKKLVISDKLDAVANLVSRKQKNSRQADESPQLYFPSPRVKINHWWQQWTRRYPFYQQHSASDCGVACLIMVGQYWGKHFGLNELRNIANVDRSGASIKGLISAAEYLGFAPRPVKADLPGLAKQELPAIVHWEGNHYIVVYKITRDRVIVADPDIGRRMLTRQEFVTGWSGYTLLLQPTAKFAQTPEAKQNLGKYIALLKPYWLVLSEIFIASLAIQVIGLFSPIFTQVLLDKVVVQQSVSTLIAIGSGLLIFSLFRIAISNLRRYLLYHTANKLDLSLIVGFISHTFQLPLSYFETRYVGDITSRISENRKVRSFITGDAITTLLDILSVFIYIILMFWYSWQLSLMALVVIPIFAITTVFTTPFLLKISRESFTARTKQKSYLIEALTGIGTIKSMGVERSVRWRWEDLINKSIKINFSGKLIRQRINICTDVIDTTLDTALLVFGIWQVINNQLTIGQLIAFNMLVDRVISPFKRLISLWNDFQEIRIAMERLDDVVNSPPETNLTNANLVTLPTLQGHIRFDNVSFRYNLESPNNTIENLSFEIHPGQTVALVGRSGSGKTTIAKLMLGLYTPTQGKIFVDNYDLNNIHLHSLRKQTGVVDQDTFLFGGTIQENLTIAHPNASFSQIQQAVKLAGAKDFIANFPLRYETQIGEGGGLLSGGQRQRLAIARALLGKPRLLIFDEATSNLDAESERIIQHNLNTILKNQSTLIIAHRLSTVRNADLILVMDNGLLVESGTHQELMDKKGQYYYLNQQQLTGV
ncbi:ABC-type bacteriocin/lantibiotic exporter with N-terminal double-glycine peptidase domain [Xenococcus sp. PCC 7305]|uniref:peptidase domain-containing ABC transporter n=1 Tax=Xenococcus sp. PCC 7305 TaxID=102125 RepID=UPI0002ACB496|nr:peptidase domain-containing ABC transporter [Xenococcus sp. PCC 7305]ELS05077.1 ABC-type bacteriocin/lantibiotic exporter with N-terminal double-glycine peptidase domain [Xenococcus sp. PCC 7305]